MSTKRPFRKVGKNKSYYKYSDEQLIQAAIDATQNKWETGDKKVLNVREFGTSIARVCYARFGSWKAFLEKANLRPTDEKLIELYQDKGLSCKEIAKIYGYTKHAIQGWLRGLNIEMRTVKDYNLVNWNREPTKFIDSRNGYVYIRYPGAKQAIPEHRIVMEKKLGRKLQSHEIIHHLNAIKDDNREENLAIVTKQSHPRKDKDTYRAALQARIRELEEQLRNC